MAIFHLLCIVRQSKRHGSVFCKIRQRHGRFRSVGQRLQYPCYTRGYSIHATVGQRLQYPCYTRGYSIHATVGQISVVPAGGRGLRRKEAVECRPELPKQFAVNGQCGDSSKEQCVKSAGIKYPLTH